MVSLVTVPQAPVIPQLHYRSVPCGCPSSSIVFIYSSMENLKSKLSCLVL